MKNQFEPLATGEVLSVNESSLFLIGHRTFRVSEIAEAIRTQLEYGISGWSQEKNAWFSEEGIPCEVLRFASNGWQKGKVRIHLEFCPVDADEEDKDISASFQDNFAVAAPTDTADELDLLANASSEDIDEALAVAAVAGSVSEPILAGPPTTMPDELELETPDLVSEMVFEQDTPSQIYAEMAQEVGVLGDDEFELEIVQTRISPVEDIDLGEMEESIDQDLELLEAPPLSDEELLDLGEMSSGSDDDLDFDMSMSAADGSDFQFEDISLDDEEEDSDSLLDDVWQDMNEASRQNNP